MFIEKAALIAGCFGEWVRLEESGDLHHVKAEFGWTPCAPIGYANVEAGLGSSFEGLPFEGDSWDRATIQFAFEFIEASGSVSENAKREFAADTMLKAAELSSQPGHRVTDGRGEIGDIGRWGDPFQPQFRPAHIAPPSVHCDYCEFSVRTLRVGELEDSRFRNGHSSEFSNGHSIIDYIRHR